MAKISRRRSMPGWPLWRGSASARTRFVIMYCCQWDACSTWGFDPRVENLPIDLDWWVYAHHWAETRFSWFYVGLNAFYMVLGIAGFCAATLRLGKWMLGSTSCCGARCF